MQSFATKTKRAIQKVAAIGTGVAMMGSTITGALALSVKLNDYPTAFKDALVVVGTAANGADDIAAAEVSGDIPTTAKVSQISGDTYTIEKSGDKWNLNENAAAIDTSVTDTELDLLSDQTFKDGEGTNTGDYDYTQTVYLPNNSSTYVFAADTSGNRDNEPVNDYLKFSSTEGRWAFNYTIKFSGSAIKIKDSADLENNVLSILGRDWTITDVSMNNASYGTVDKLTLLAGDVMSTILQGSTVGGVTVIDVDEAETKCIIEYAGKTYIVDKGQTKTFDDGTIVGVTDVTAVHESGAGQDMCELAIGAHKLVLEDGKRANVNNEDVDNSYTFISGNETQNTAGLKFITVSYQPEDDTWLTVGESLEDPTFGAFKMVFNSINEKDVETIKVDPIGDKVKLIVQNKDGDLFDDYFCYLNGTGTTREFKYGFSDNKPMAVFNNEFISNHTVGTAGTYVTGKGLRGVRFLMSFSGLSHIAEITDIDTSTNKTTIKMLDSGEIYKDLDYVDGGTSTFSDIHSSLAINYSINLWNGAAFLALNNGSFLRFTTINDKGPTWYTKNDGNITFTGNATVVGTPITAINQEYRESSGITCELLFAEEGSSVRTLENDQTAFGHANGQRINISFGYDPTDDQIQFNRSGSSALGESLTLVQKDSEAKYEYVGRTPNYGTRVEMYQKDDGDLTIYLPSESITAEVVVAASEAVTGTMSTANVVKESDVTDVTAQNVILVGGPCANGLTAKLSSASTVWPECASGYQNGEGFLKLLANGDKVALIVSGYSADDTKRAAIALGGSLPAKEQANVLGTSLELSEIEVV